MSPGFSMKHIPWIPKSGDPIPRKGTNPRPPHFTSKSGAKSWCTKFSSSLRVEDKFPGFSMKYIPWIPKISDPIPREGDLPGFPLLGCHIFRINRGIFEHVTVPVSEKCIILLLVIIWLMYKRLLCNVHTWRMLIFLKHSINANVDLRVRFEVKR